MEEKAGFHVEFEQRPVEDREQSIKQGMPVYKDVEVAILTMPGASLVVDKFITDELLYEWRHGDNKRKPPSPQAVHVRSLENLAEANADTIRKLGMGGVALVEKAKNYLKAAGNNKASEEIGSMQVKLDSLIETIAKKDAQIEELLEALGEDKPKRKKKAA